MVFVTGLAQLVECPTAVISKVIVCAVLVVVKII